jgi:murein DD-endopeptidase MepM/ murein hydrolase activator NlpD
MPLASLAAALGTPALLVVTLAVAPTAVTPTTVTPTAVTPTAVTPSAVTPTAVAPGSPKLAPPEAALVAATRDPRASPGLGGNTGPPVVAAAGPPAAAGAATADPPGRLRAGEGFHWPISGRPVIGRRFILGPYPWSPGHRGVDLVVPPGRPVLAPAAGVVRFAGPVANRGVLTLDHGGGLLTSYEPVRPAVRAGQRVQAGAVIGWLGPPAGHCPASCLHWGARRAGRYLDPLSLLAGWPGPPILLPLR